MVNNINKKAIQDDKDSGTTPDTSTDTRNVNKVAPGDSQARMDDIKLIVDSWKEEGYNVSGIEGSFDKSIEELELLFLEFSDKINTLVEVEEELDDLKSTYEPILDQIAPGMDEIRALLKAPHSADDAYDKLMALKKEADTKLDEAVKTQAQDAEKEQRLEDIKLFIEDWKSDDFDTSELEGILDSDLPAIEEKFATIGEQIAEGKEALDRLDRIKTGLGDGTEFLMVPIVELDKILHVPATVKDGLITLKSYEDMISNNADLPKTFTKLKTVKNGGVDTSSIEEEMQKDPTKFDWAGLPAKLDELAGGSEEVKDAITKLEDAISGAGDEPNDELTGKLVDAGKLLDALNKSPTPALVEEAYALNDTIAELVKAQQLEAQAQGEMKESVVKEIDESLKVWASEGVDVSNISSDLDKEKPVEELQMNLANIKTKVDMVKENLGKLQKLRSLKSSSSMQAEIDDLAKAIADPTTVEEAAPTLIQLEYALKKEEEKMASDEKDGEKREYIKKMVNAWTNEGFMMDNILPLLDGDIEELDTKFNQYKKDIATIEELKVGLSKIDVRGMEDEVVPIYQLIIDPEKTAEVTTLIDTLEKQVAENSVKREEIIGIVNTWKEDGYDVSTIESSYNADLKTLEELFGEFSNKILKLQGLDARIRALDPTGIEKKIRMLEEKVKNPEAITQIEEELKYLESGGEVPAAEEPATEEAAPAADEPPATGDAEMDRCMNLLNEWTKQGYSMEELLEQLEQQCLTEEEIFEHVADLEKKVARAEELKAMVAKLDANTFADDVNLIMDNISNLDILEDLEEHYNDLIAREGLETQELHHVGDEEKPAEPETPAEPEPVQEQPVNEQFMQQMEGLRTAGYDVGRLEAFLKSDMDTQNHQMEQYLQDIQQLEGVKGKYMILRDQFPHGHQDSMIMYIDTITNDPDQINNLLAIVTGLEAINTGGVFDFSPFIPQGVIDSSAISKQAPAAEAPTAEAPAGEKELVSARDMDISEIEGGAKKKKKVKKKLIKRSSSRPRPVARPRPKPKAKAKSKTKTKTEEAEPEVDATAERITNLLELSTMSMKGQDYKKAVDYYDQILKLVPNHKIATFKKKRAVFLYNQQKERGEEPPAAGTADQPPLEPAKQDEPAAEEAKPEETSAEPAAEETPADAPAVPDNATKCMWCQGTGKCSDCGGTGKIGDNECTQCKGSGKCWSCNGTGLSWFG